MKQIKEFSIPYLKSRKFLSFIIFLVIILFAFIPAVLYLLRNNIQSGGQFVPGELMITFNKDANPDIVKEQFSSQGIILPPDALRSEYAVLATPHQGEAKYYTDKLTADPLIINVDHSNTLYRSDVTVPMHILEDTEYLTVRFKHPLSIAEEEHWLKQKYPELKDAGLLHPDQDPLELTYVDDKTGERGTRQSINWWKSLIVTITVPQGQEDQYLNRIRTFPNVLSVERVLNPPPPN